MRGGRRSEDNLVIILQYYKAKQRLTYSRHERRRFYIIIILLKRTYVCVYRKHGKKSNRDVERKTNMKRKKGKEECKLEERGE